MGSFGPSVTARPIQAGVKMDPMKISNMSRLSSLADTELLDNVHTFHQKTKFLLDNRMPNYGKFSIGLPELAALEYTDNEISPFFHQSINIASQHKVNFKRKGSHDFFSTEKLSFAHLQSLLCESFSANETGKRPYPSAGALYPVETIAIMMEERMTDAPQSGIYHFRPSLNTLQLLRHVTTKDLYDSIFIEDIQQLGTPSVAFVYVVNLQKATVKYSYRGYRNAIAEVGSMYQQADLVASALGLKNRLSGSFSDDQLTRFLELDNQVYAPIALQYFGA